MEIFQELEKGNSLGSVLKIYWDCSEAFYEADTSLLCLESQGTEPDHFSCKEMARYS